MSLRQRLAAVEDVNIVVPAPVRAELFYGAARSHDPHKARHGDDDFLARFAPCLSMTWPPTPMDVSARTWRRKEHL